MERLKNIEKTNYKAVSLFCGIGGFDIALENAGFEVIWANDIDKYACQTYRANVGDFIQEGDISNYIDVIPQHDILTGGFPCQPYSTLGKKRV